MFGNILNEMFTMIRMHNCSVDEQVYQTAPNQPICLYLTLFIIDRFYFHFIMKENNKPSNRKCFPLSGIQIKSEIFRFRVHHTLCIYHV